MNNLNKSSFQIPTFNNNYWTAIFSNENFDLSNMSKLDVFRLLEEKLDYERICSVRSLTFETFPAKKKEQKNNKKNKKKKKLKKVSMIKTRLPFDC